MIFVSTGLFPDLTALQVIQKFIDHGITDIELSGGRSFNTLFLEELSSYRVQCNFQIHNYFPPPAQPFVFNLGSTDHTIGKLSIQHAQKAILLSASLGLKTYSFHAGFLFDPGPAELGQPIKRKRLYDHKTCLHLFVDRVNKLADFAKKEEVQLLIENNVISADNYDVFSGNPFLMSAIEETKYVMKQTCSNVNLLVDTGHLKVSARTLFFDRVFFLESLEYWIKGYHLSENDGLRDTHEPLSIDSWFWPHIKKNMSYYSLEINCPSIAELKQQRELTQRILCQ